MAGLIETLLSAGAGRKIFAAGERWITAGEIRAMAARLASTLGDGPVFVHTASASCFTACALAAAARGKTIFLPAHTQPAYLTEIGGAGITLLTDASCTPSGADAPLEISEPDPLLVFFTSGTTDKPRPVEKSFSRLETEARELDSLWAGAAGHVVSTVSHQHIYGMLFRIAWPILSQRTSDDAAAPQWEALKGRLGGSTLVSSPAHLTRLPPQDDLFTPAPALIFSSGQLLTSAAARACLDVFGAPVTEVLGSTETGGIAWRRQTEPDAPWTPLPSVCIVKGEDSALMVSSPFLQSPGPLVTGDTIEFNADGRFHLKPRGDRIVKVDGKRISLARVEALLSAAPEIESLMALTLAAQGEPLAAVAVLSDAGRAALASEGAFRLSRRLRLASDELEAAERPKRWRFVDAMPSDSQGKVTLAALRALFATSDPLAALDLDIRQCSETGAEIAFALAPDLIFFDGHFPEHAILPGVAQAHLAVLIGQSIWGEWPSDANLARLKFRRVLTPNDYVVLTLKRDAKIGRLSFSYKYGDVIASQGDIGGFTL